MTAESLAMRRITVALALIGWALSADAQMVETFKDDQRSLSAEVAVEVYFCERDGGFVFSLYDQRVNPQQRFLHKYQVRGLEVATGKMKRAKTDRTACEGAPEVALSSERVTVEPIPVPEEEDFIWVLQLRLEGNISLPVVVSREGLPFVGEIEYHQETKEFRVREQQ